MKKLGRDIALDCAKLLNVILLTLPFALCWFGYYAGRIADPFHFKGNWLVVGMFSLLYILFARVYDAFLVSFQRAFRMICVSME